MYISETKPNEADDSYQTMPRRAYGTIYKEIHDIFLLYRVLSPFLYLILVTVFATVDFDSPLVPAFADRNGITVKESLGLSMLIYAWTASFVWPAVFHFVVYDQLKETPPRDLSYYVKKGEYDEALSLAEFGADTKERGLALLSESVSRNPVGVVRFLHFLCLKCPEQIDEEHILYPLERVAKEGGSVLHIAVQSDAMRTLFEDYYYTSAVLSDLLMKRIADVNAVNDDGDSALAVIARRTEIQSVDVLNAALLIENGIGAKLKEKAQEIECEREGEYADEFARIIGGEDVKPYLMFRCIYESEWRTFDEAFDEAIKSASDINAKDGFGNTLLLAVVSRLEYIGALKVKNAVQRVLAKNTDKSITDKRGRTAKDIVDQWEPKYKDDVQEKKAILGMLL